MTHPKLNETFESPDPEHYDGGEKYSHWNSYSAKVVRGVTLRMYSVHDPAHPRDKQFCVTYGRKSAERIYDALLSAELKEPGA